MLGGGVTFTFTGAAGSTNCVPANSLMLLRRLHGDVSREIAGIVEQNELLGLGTIKRCVFFLIQFDR